MKNCFIKIVLITVLAVSSFAQTDSLIKTKEASMTYLRVYHYKIPGSDSIFQRGGFAEIINIKNIKFLSKDSLIACDNQNYSVCLSTDKIKEVSYSQNNPENIWLGGFLGGFAGCTAGLLIGALTTIDFNFDFGSAPSHYEDKHDHTLNYLIGGIVGTVIGSSLGILIGVSLNQKTLNLFSVPEKDKKSELIKFLKQN